MKYYNEYNEYSENQKKLVRFLNQEGKYPFSLEKCRLVITKVQENKDMDNIIQLYNSYLDSPISIIEGELITFYHNKDRVPFKDIVNSISEDIGTKVQIFEGFLCNTKDVKKLLELKEKYLKKDYTYANVVDLIYEINDKEKMKEMKEILLKEELEDYQFLQIAKGMFTNNLNVSQTANYLYMHRNTLNKKLDMIEDKTTLSLRTFRDAVALYELLK